MCFVFYNDAPIFTVFVKVSKSPIKKIIVFEGFFFQKKLPVDLRPENSTAKVTLCLYIEHKLRGKRGERFVFRHLLLCKAFETNTGRSVSAWI